jgi:hypothetical protein
VRLETLRFSHPFRHSFSPYFADFEIRPLKPNGYALNRSHATAAMIGANARVSRCHHCCDSAAKADLETGVIRMRATPENTVSTVGSVSEHEPRVRTASAAAGRWKDGEAWDVEIADYH